jgi:ABC-type sugar transport system ATPase subunit
MVYQEFGLVPYLTVTENILMGRLPTRLGRIDWREARRQAAAALSRLDSVVSPDAVVGGLKVADQQEVEIARALSYEPVVFIMDEPSSALSRVEIDNLYRLVNALRANGVAVIYITHKLEEVFALADRVTVLRDGSVVGTYDIGDLDAPTLIERMTGKPVGTDLVHVTGAAAGAAGLLDLRGFSVEGLFEDVTFSVAPGTILGIAGVIGAGKSELARAIVGLIPPGRAVRGTVGLAGRAIEPTRMSPHRARALGIGFVSEDRQAEGIVQAQPVQFNIVLPALGRVTSLFSVVRRRARALALSVMDEVRLRPREPDKPVSLLSGGNQQKVVIGKWLAARSRLLILDEPTRGIDIGARQEIYDLIRQQAKDNGLAVLLLSSDLREVLVASDRILVMVEGRITGEIEPAEATEQVLLERVLASGLRPAARAA